jgi:hypothetical protein
MTDTKKKDLGQFFTTNYEYILQGFKVPDSVKIVVEPFAGKCDLLKFINKSLYKVELYDLDPSSADITKRDSKN